MEYKILSYRVKIISEGKNRYFLQNAYHWDECIFSLINLRKRHV